MNPKRPTPRHITIKMAKFKDKQRILKEAREKQPVTYKGTPIRLSSDFSTETQQAKRDWHNVFHIMKSKHLQPRTSYPVRLSFKMESEIASQYIFLKRRKEYISIKLALQEMLKELL